MHEQSSATISQCDSFLTKLDLVSLKLDGISKCLHISLSILKIKVCFQMPFRKGCRHHISLDAWHQFQTVRLHWLSRAFFHLLARHTLQQALRHHQARRHRWWFASHLIVFSSQRVARKSLDFKPWKPFHSTKHLCAIGFASIAHIVSYLCRIFLPPSFSTNAKLFL